MEGKKTTGAVRQKTRIEEKKQAERANLKRIDFSCGKASRDIINPLTLNAITSLQERRDRLKVKQQNSPSKKMLPAKVTKNPEEVIIMSSNFSINN
jgi:hypothetical protein